jgi:hypothetical protein
VAARPSGSSFSRHIGAQSQDADYNDELWWANPEQVQTNEAEFEAILKTLEAWNTELERIGFNRIVADRGPKP